MLIYSSSVSYGLHMRVNLPERHANSLRATQSIQGISLALNSHGYVFDPLCAPK